MLKNYFITAIRNLERNILFTSINIFGLAIGISCSILIYLYVLDELSFDKFHSKSDRIYRLNEFIAGENGGFSERSASLPFPVAEAIKEEFPNFVEESIRFFNFQAPLVAVAYPDKNIEFNETRLFFVDSNYYKVLDIPFISGESSKSLSAPNTVLITKNIATKYFGENWKEEEVIGEFLKFQGRTDLLITGILEEAPLNAHFQYDFLVSFSSLRELMGGTNSSNNWYWNPCWTYILLKENVDYRKLKEQFPGFVKKFFPEIIRNEVTLDLQPITDIHLNSNLDFEIQPNSNKNNVYIFSGIAIFILLIACINFMNLSTARSVKRAKEVGVRKTFGSRYEQLVFQFLTESFLMTGVSMVLALAFTSLILPWFNNFTEKSIGIDPAADVNIILLLIILTFIVGVFSGIYPAVILSSFKPVKVLKSEYQKVKGLTFRKMLVVFQFFISITLIIGTFVILKQLNHLKTDELGFQKENIIMVPVIQTPIGKHYGPLKEKFLSYSKVLEVSAVEEILGAKHQGANYRFDGMENSKLFSRLNVRHDFLQTFGVELIAGRDFSKDFDTDDRYAIIVNEELVSQMGWGLEEAVGQKYHFGRYEGEVIGVIKNFNFTSKHHSIAPLILDLNLSPHAFNLFIKYMGIKIAHDDIPSSIAYLRETWKTFLPERPFEYFFLDKNLENLYKSEANLSKVTGIFSVIAILVASLGLLGLAAYSIEQRKKEIGIRKVLGSSIIQILMLLSKDFLQLIGVAFVIACPVAWYGLEKWLESFAFRINLDFYYFILAGMITILVALFTILLQSLKTVNNNLISIMRED
ncbi:ABC transporter permease [Flexithrix dorotheae]|uniref:ABC transporter permease n=1 Tax=Flexithrix dorotheae TaxID=70993 RepID=UPI00037D7D38|nr:ABC transporter permease [Flexithrix dorotheae]